MGVTVLDAQAAATSGGTISGLTTGTIPKAASSTSLTDSAIIETTNYIQVQSKYLLNNDYGGDPAGGSLGNFGFKIQVHPDNAAVAHDGSLYAIIGVSTVYDTQNDPQQQIAIGVYGNAIAVSANANTLGLCYAVRALGDCYFNDNGTNGVSCYGIHAEAAGTNKNSSGTPLNSSTAVINNYGVYAKATAAPGSAGTVNNYALYAIAANGTSNWAAWFDGNVNIVDGSNVVLGTSDGTQWGTEASQKQAWFGAPPVVQQSHINDPSGAATDQDDEARAAIVSILDLLETYGFMAT
jgi:hypothetical protein